MSILPSLSNFQLSFSGQYDECPLSFLNSWSRLAKLYSWSNEHQALIFPSYLKGIALKWYLSNFGNHVSDISWNEILTSFKLRFQQKDFYESNLSILLNRKQRDNESVEDYLKAFLELSTNILNEIELVRWSLLCMKPHLSSKLMSSIKDLTTFNELIRMAKAVELQIELETKIFGNQSKHRKRKRNKKPSNCEASKSQSNNSTCKIGFSLKSSQCNESLSSTNLSASKCPSNVFQSELKDLNSYPTQFAYDYSEFDFPNEAQSFYSVSISDIDKSNISTTYNENFSTTSCSTIQLNVSTDDFSKFVYNSKQLSPMRHTLSLSNYNSTDDVTANYNSAIFSLLKRSNSLPSILSTSNGYDFKFSAQCKLTRVNTNCSQVVNEDLHRTYSSMPNLSTWKMTEHNSETVTYEISTVLQSDRSFKKSVFPNTLQENLSCKESSMQINCQLLSDLTISSDNSQSLLPFGNLTDNEFQTVSEINLKSQPSKLCTTFNLLNSTNSTRKKRKPRPRTYARNRNNSSSAKRYLEKKQNCSRPNSQLHHFESGYDSTTSVFTKSKSINLIRIRPLSKLSTTSSQDSLHGCHINREYIKSRTSKYRYWSPTFDKTLSNIFSADGSKVTNSSPLHLLNGNGITSQLKTSANVSAQSQPSTTFKAADFKLKKRNLSNANESKLSLHSDPFDFSPWKILN